MTTTTLPSAAPVAALLAAGGVRAGARRGHAPDPADFGALLSAAVAAHCARTGVSKAAVARLAGIARGNFTTALRNPDARPATVRAVCRALGLKVALVPVGPDAATLRRAVDRHAAEIAELE